jgi:hypothetical protein
MYYGHGDDWHSTHEKKLAVTVALAGDYFLIIFLTTGGAPTQILKRQICWAIY